MIAGLDGLEAFALFCAYVAATTVLFSGCPDHHNIEPPEWMQELFILGRNCHGKFSICGIIWGSVTYITWPAFWISYFGIDVFYSAKQYAAATIHIIFAEIILIFLPLAIYTIVCWGIEKLHNKSLPANKR